MLDGHESCINHRLKCWLWNILSNHWLRKYTSASVCVLVCDRSWDFWLRADVCDCWHLVEGLPDALVDDNGHPHHKGQDSDDENSDDKVLDVLRDGCVIHLLGSDPIHCPYHHEILGQDVPIQSKQSVILVNYKMLECLDFKVFHS